MPRLPYVSQVSANTGRSNTPTLQNAYDAQAFGADAGRAVGNLAGATNEASDMLANEAIRQRNEAAANAVAGFDFTPQKLELRNKAAPDGTGYRETVLNAYDAAVDSYANTISDSGAAKKFKEAMRQQRIGLSAESADWEFKTREAYNKDQADVGLNTIQNKVSADPNFYQTGLQQMADVIDARPGLTQLQKTAMKQTGNYELTRRRFEGLLQNTTTLDGIKAIDTELKQPQWSDKFKPEDYYRMQERIDTAKKTLVGQAKSRAEAEVSGLKDMAKSTTLIPTPDLQRAQQAVRLTGDYKLMTEMAQIARGEAIKSEIVKLPVAEQQRKSEAAAQAAKDGRGAVTLDLPTDLADTIQKVSAGSGVSAGYMAALIKREYGSKLGGANPDYGAPTDILGPDGKPTSTAVGVGQFTNGTFLGLMRDPNVAAAMGVNTLNMSDAQLLDLRKNKDVSVAAIAALALQNQKSLQATLGRPVDDAELYMAHFLGADGAAKLITAYQTTPDAKAADVLPAAADANKPVFYRDKNALSVSDVYNSIASQFSTTSAKVAFEDQETYKRVIDATEKAVKEDPMTHAQTVGLVQLPSLQDQGGFAATGRVATQVANYFNIPRDTMKPFRAADADVLNKQLEDGSSDQAVQIMANVAQMGPMAKGAMKQLGEKDPLFGYAGALYLQTGPGVAGDIIRGHKLIKSNPKILEQAGFAPGAVNTAFAAHSEGALNGIDPEVRRQVYDAALAYTLQQSSKGSSTPKFDPKVFEQGLDKVLGGGIANVNGVKTMLPVGVDAPTLNNAIGNMTTGDWTHLSDSGAPPRRRDGSLASADTLNDEVVLQAVGGNRYAVMDSNGSPLYTGRTDGNGRAEVFTITADPQVLKNIADRKKKPFEMSWPKG